MERSFLAFHSPGFRWLWANTVFDSIYRTVDIIAQGWLVLAITDSPFWVGAAASTRGVSMLLVSPFAGVLADRLDRRNLLRGLQAFQATIAGLIAYLIIVDGLELWHIMLLSFLSGSALTLSMTVRWTLTMDLVGRSTLLNANAANFMAFSSVQIVSSAFGGWIMSVFGVGSAYLLIGASLAVAVVITFMVPSVATQERLRGSPWRDFRDGAALVLENPALRSMFYLATVMGLFAYSYNYLLPIMARDVLQVGATGLGFLASAGGIGSLVAILVVVNLGNIKAEGRLLVFGAMGFGAFLILFAASPWFLLSLVLVAAAKGCAMVYDSMITTLLQTNAPDQMRGRVMSSYALTFGVTPIGGLQAGAIAGVLGAPLAIGIGAAAVCAYSLRMTRLLSRFQREEEDVGL